MDFKERLLKERDELSLKLDKLNIFIKSEGFGSIELNQQILLKIQSKSMGTYLACLTERINLL